MAGIVRWGGLTLLVFGVSCDAVRSITGSPEDQVVALKVQRTEILDGLYAQYGGSDIANATTAVAKEVEKIDGTNPAVDMVVGLVSEGDRELFEDNCNLIGSGERSTVLTTKAREFFAQDHVKTQCLKVGKLSRKVQALQDQINASTR